MADRPIIFSAPMVRALLDGRKTQTRRVLKPKGGHTHIQCTGAGDWFWWTPCKNFPHSAACLPYAIGDRLYVREAHSLHRAHGQDFKPGGFDHGKRWGPWSGLPIAVSPDKTQIAYYCESFDRSGPPKWRPSIHMPRWASRLTLTVTEVRVQRLLEISEPDAWAEGCKPGVLNDRGEPFPAEEHALDGKSDIGWDCARDWFADIWETINGPDAWDVNPWVVAVSFNVARGNIDESKGGAE